MSNSRAEFSVATTDRVEFFASWPKNAKPEELRRVAAALPAILHWWADRIEQQPTAADAEYASWFPVNPHGVKGQTE